MIEQSQALMVAPDVSVARRPTLPWQDFSGMMTFAEIAYDSGLCPKHIQTWQAALVIMQKATELAIPPIEGLMGIYMIDGKTVISSRLLAGLVTRAFGPRAVEVTHSDDTRATVRYWRPGAEARELSWTIEQAQQAGLAPLGEYKGKDNWRKFPAAMLRARAISAVCSFAFADVIGGLMTPDEADIPTVVTPDGDVVIDISALKTIPAPKPDVPRQITQGNTHTDQPAKPADSDAAQPAKDDGHLAAPPHWIPDLRRLATLEAERLVRPLRDVPDTLTRAAARTLKAQLEASLATAPVESPALAPSGRPSGGATQQQIDRLRKLQTALGRPALVPEGLTGDQAAATILELVAAFNAQSRGGQTQTKAVASNPADPAAPPANPDDPFDGLPF